MIGSFNYLKEFRKQLPFLAIISKYYYCYLQMQRKIYPKLRLKICFNAILNKCVWKCIGAMGFLDAIDNDIQEFHFQGKYVNVMNNIEITQINVKNILNS